VPPHWAWWLAAFLAFRLFDIAKPWPIRWLDHRVAGGFGIMIDDVVAAGYALAVLQLARWWLG
jgi:phosphatidylglycerophosphatase A